MATYLFETATGALNPVNLEQELGLNRGDIVQVTVYPTGAVEIETSVTLTVAKQTALRSRLVARGLSYGVKPSF